MDLTLTLSNPPCPPSCLHRTPQQLAVLEPLGPINKAVEVLVRVVEEVEEEVASRKNLIRYFRCCCCYYCCCCCYCGCYCFISLHSSFRHSLSSWFCSFLIYASSHLSVTNHYQQMSLLPSCSLRVLDTGLVPVAAAVEEVGVG